MRGMSTSGLSGGSSPMRERRSGDALGVVAHALEIGDDVDDGGRCGAGRVAIGCWVAISSEACSSICEALRR